MVDSSPQGAPIDRYVVLEYLSEGGMGAIYIGKKLGAGGFEKEVVLKQLLPEFTQQPEFIDLFLREARLSATLDHANIIHTIDLVTAGDEYFIVMEYLPGADLRTILKKTKRRKRAFSPAAGIYVAREMLSALAYAHNKSGPDDQPLRLIHRDVSPSNILVSQNGEVKLTDFGIAKAATHNSVFYRVKGKIGYMSPEQAKSEPLDHRSDLYSLAVCVYEIITGERLFVHAGLTTSAEEIYSQPVPLLSRKVPGIPPELDKVMLKALALDPDHRYQTAGEFQEALLRVAHRFGLMMSAPELAQHLRAVCGEPDTWRSVNEARATSLGAGTQALAGGTELYDVEGTEQIDTSGVGQRSAGELLSVVDEEREEAPLLSAKSLRKRRALTSLTNLTRLQGVELTSMAKLAAMDEAGAQPLVDLDDLQSAPLVSPRSPDDDELDRVAAAAMDSIASLEEGDDPRSPAGSKTEGSLISTTPLPAHVYVDRGADAQAPAAEPRSEVAPSNSTSMWLALLVILLLGIGAAAAVGLSGPSLPRLPQTPAPAPSALPGTSPESSAASTQPSEKIELLDAAIGRTQ